MAKERIRNEGGGAEKLPEGLPDVRPAHVAIIMDGNGRWAQARGLPRLAGHRAGTENLRRVIEACVEFKIRYLTIYAFSTENWTRPEEEVSGLFNIIDDVIDRELENLNKNGVQLRHVGKMDGIRPELQEKIRRSLELTRNNQRLVLSIAFNYGGRDELIQAVRTIVRSGVAADQVDEALISRSTYTPDTPDPDLLIRTSGEQRISNFLPWQAVYTELYFPPCHWPDFDKEELRKALWEFSRRQRRFGGTPTPGGG